ncbi:hypothetical protein [Thermococcus sp.]
MIKLTGKMNIEVVAVIIVFLIFAAIGNLLTSGAKSSSKIIPNTENPGKGLTLSPGSNNISIRSTTQWKGVLNESFEISHGNYQYYCFNIVNNNANSQARVKISLETYNNVPVNLFVVSFSEFAKFQMGSSFEYYVYPSMLSTSNGVREWSIPPGLNSFCIILTMPSNTWNSEAGGKIEVLASPPDALEFLSEGQST